MGPLEQVNARAPGRLDLDPQPAVLEPNVRGVAFRPAAISSKDKPLAEDKSQVKETALSRDRNNKATEKTVRNIEQPHRALPFKEEDDIRAVAAVFASRDKRCRMGQRSGPPVMALGGVAEALLEPRRVSSGAMPKSTKKPVYGARN